MKPAIAITDPRFVWTPAVATDIRARFDAIRKQQREAAAKAEAATVANSTHKPILAARAEEKRRAESNVRAIK